MAVSFEYYKIFYYVAKHHSITMAAQELSLSQPNITRSIQNLEAQLGCQLFTRSKKGVVLTPEGKMIYKRIFSACELLFSAEEEIEHITSVTTGIVCIGTDDLNIRRNYLLSLTERFLNLYPNVKLRLIQKDGVELLEALETGTLDLCIMADSSPEIENLSTAVDYTPTLESRLIFEYPDTVIVGKKYKYLTECEITLQELSHYPLIIWMPDTATRNYFDEIFRQKEIVMSPAIELSNIEFQILLTEHGFGYSFVPRHCVDEKILQGVIFPLKLIDCHLQRRMMLITNKTRPLSFAARKFLNLLKS